MTVRNKRILASVLFVLISFVCVANDPPPPPGPPPPVGDVPIDGGVLLSIVFALCYGVRKLMLNNKK